MKKIYKIIKKFGNKCIGNELLKMKIENKYYENKKELDKDLKIIKYFISTINEKTIQNINTIKINLLYFMLKYYEGVWKDDVKKIEIKKYIDKTFSPMVLNNYIKT